MGCALLAAAFAPPTFGQSATTYYLDVNGATPGFGNPDGLGIDWAATDWTTDPAGNSATVALPNWYVGANFYPSQLVFGYPGTTGISNSTFTLTANGPMIAGVTFNAPCTVNLATFNIFSFLAPETWVVPAGSTFSIAQANANWAFTTVTMQGGGTVNFNCNDVGRNAGNFIQDMTNGTVNLTDAYGDSGVAQASYELRNGTLNFATSASAEAIGGSAPAGSQVFKLSGGTVDNTSGVAITLSLRSAACKIGGSFGFAGSSALDFGPSTVDLGTVTPTITVSNNTLEFDGPLTNTAGLTKAGAGTLMLTAANIYTGNTTISAGTLALSGGGSITSSPVISIAGGATFDVSGLASAAALASGKILQVDGGSSSATLVTAAGRELSLADTTSLRFTAFKPTEAGGAIPLILSGAGTLNLGANTPVIVTVVNGGMALGPGGSPYKLIAKGGGSVTTVPGGILTVNGDGNIGSASLSISNGELYVVINGSSVPTTTTLALTSGSPVYGNAGGLTFTATVKTNGVAAGNASSNFVFSVDGIVMATNAPSGGSADFTIGSLSAGPHLITAGYSGDANYKPSTNSLSQVIRPLVVGLTGTRPYDGTADAAFNILTITNIIGGDNVYPASGSVGLAEAGPGVEAIVSANTLTLGGAQAANYAVASLTGSVVIAKPAATYLLLTSSLQTNRLLGSVTFTATVQANGATASGVTGFVTFKTNGVPFSTNSLIAGVASSFTTTNLPLGTSFITAEYPGDSNFPGSTNTLSQVMVLPASVTYSNSMMLLTIGTNGGISSLIRRDNGENEIFHYAQDPYNFYIYHAQDNTTIPLTHMFALGPNLLEFWTDDGQYSVTFAVTATNRYLKFALVHVSNVQGADNPLTGALDASWPGHAVSFSMLNLNDGWFMNFVPLDYMFRLNAPYNSWTGNPSIYWPYIQYAQMGAYTGPDSQTTNNLQPMGAVAIFSSRSDAEHDDILLDVWGAEPTLPIPNRANRTNWTRADAVAWLDRFERELPPMRQLSFTPNNLNDLYQCADFLFQNGLNTLYLFPEFWQGRTIGSVNTNLFPNGLAGLTAFEQYCAQRGIRLDFHNFACGIDFGDPVYGALSPTGPDPGLARFGTGTLVNGIASGSTSASVQVDPASQVMVAPPPWGDYLSYYPPYYFSIFSPVININDDLMFGSVQAVNSTHWTVSGISHTGWEQYGENHPAGSHVDFLLAPYGSEFVPDSRSSLLGTTARLYGTLMNEENICEAVYDAMEIHEDIGFMGTDRFSQLLYESLDHPVHASGSFGYASFGHFEYNFNRIRAREGGYEFAAGSAPQAMVRLSDPSFMPPHPDDEQFCFGFAAATSQNFAISGYHEGVDLNTINHYGKWSEILSSLNTWQAVSPYLTSAQKAALQARVSSPPGTTYYGEDFYVAAQSGNQWTITPTRAMLREGMDAPYQNMQEWGDISPHQFIQANGGELSPLNNPYAAQTPEIELLVQPGMSAANINNVSLMPTSSGNITHPAGETQSLNFNNGVLSVTANNSGSSGDLYFYANSGTASYWNYSTLGHGSTLNMSRSRGIALTVIGDNSGAELVFSIGGRDYVVPVNFSGERTIEIPNGEAAWYKTGFGANGATYGTFNYTNVNQFQLFLGHVPAGVSASVQVSSIQTMQEDQSTGLVNPVLSLNGNSVIVAGTIAYNNYLTYSGGAGAQIYDANWNYLTTLLVTGSALTAVNGNNAFSVTASNSPNVWLATRVKVSGTPWVINQPAAIHEWRFEDNANDTAGTANGTAINGPVYAAGIEGAAALTFDGASQYVNVPNVANLQFTSAQSFTISAWVKLNSLPNAAASIVAKDPAAGAWYGLGISAANQWSFTGATNIVSPTAADIGQWHLIAGVQDGAAGTRKLYVDGLLMASGAAQNGSGTGALRIAALPGTTPIQFLDGAVDDVRIYNQALAPTDISMLATNLASPGNNFITGSFNAGQLVLDWPANQLWQLQAQTNGLGATNWFDVTGATPPYTINIVPAQPSVFYRLTHP
ncbi:MAG TPA: LamG-like jellyroll fold domain-containing protein [Verrucomicrobiae bacterium]|nr:LamG-like jellyroll fold domain-containing protein [Verrucomicrobiae bacterium]